MGWICEKLKRKKRKETEGRMLERGLMQGRMELIGFGGRGR